MEGVRGRIALERTEPCEHITQRVDSRADRFRAHLNEVDVLRVAKRLAEEQLVDRSAASAC